MTKINTNEFKQNLVVCKTNESAKIPYKEHSIDSGYDIFIPKFDSVIDVLNCIKSAPLEFTSDALTVAYIQKLNIKLTVSEKFSKGMFGQLMDTVTQDEFTIYELMNKYITSLNSIINSLLVNVNLQVTGSNCRLDNKEDFFNYIKGNSGRVIPDLNFGMIFYQVNNISMDEKKYNSLSETVFPKLVEVGKEQGIDFQIGFEWTSPKLGIMVAPSEGVLIDTYLRMSVSPGHDLVVNNKSGIAAKKGLTVGAEIIDSGYFGHVFINLYNNTNHYVPITSEEKITQILIRGIGLSDIEVITEDEMIEYSTTFNEFTARGEGNLGSTN